MNELYIFTGLPYSGKTTLRNELQKRFGFEAVSVDDIMRNHDMWREGHPTQEDWNAAYSEAYEKIENQLKMGKTVIFDTGNLPRRERDKAKAIAKNLGIESKLIYINTPREEILRRRAENEETKKRGQLDDNLMATALSMFEEPIKDENPIIYNNEIDLDKWLEENLR